jgi:hypothetical protein
MVDKSSVSNNDVYNERTEYKGKSCCIGLRCNKKSKAHLYQISLTIGSSYLCTDCKKSVEQIGCTLQTLEYSGNLKEEKKSSNRQLEIKNDVTNIKRINKGNRSSSKTLPELQ